MAKISEQQRSILEVMARDGVRIRYQPLFNQGAWLDASEQGFRNVHLKTFEALREGYYIRQVASSGRDGSAYAISPEGRKAVGEDVPAHVHSWRLALQGDGVVVYCNPQDGQRCKMRFVASNAKIMRHVLEANGVTIQAGEIPDESEA